MKGRDLYYDFYSTKDHVAVAAFITGKLVCQRWIVSYDNASEIRELYKGYQRLDYEIGYSARQSSRGGREVMFFGNSLRVPPLVGPLKIVKDASMRKKDDQQFSPEETQKRFEAALRGARMVGLKPTKKSSPKKPSARKPRKKANAST